MEIELFKKENIDLLKWSQNKEGEFAKKYIYPLIKEGTKKYIDNVDVEMQVIVFADHLFPISVTNLPAKESPREKNSYVCSPTSHYIDYGKEEAEIELKDKHFLRNISHLLLNTCNYFFNKLSFEKVIYVNNWLLSTNLYYEFNLDYLSSIKDFLVKNFPDYTIIFRSINDLYNISLYNWIVHQSSGVSKFKLFRGAEPSIEYNMVYYSHLPKLRRIPWQTLEKLTDYVIVPIMKKYQL